MEASSDSVQVKSVKETLDINATVEDLRCDCVLT